jgi:ubiquinone biosynthesis protein
MAKMVFEDGFFHADPHPGNYFIQPDGRIANHRFRHGRHTE